MSRSRDLRSPVPETPPPHPSADDPPTYDADHFLAPGHRLRSHGEGRWPASRIETEHLEDFRNALREMLERARSEGAVAPRLDDPASPRRPPRDKP